MNYKRRPDRAAAMVAVLSMLMQPAAHVFVAASQSQPPANPTSAPPPAQPPAKPPAAAATPVDGGWPRMYSLPSEGSILVYQPQISSWENQTALVAFSAVSYRSKAGDKPALGTIKIEANTKVAVADRLVSFQQMKITEATFQHAPEGAGARDHRNHRQGDSRRRAGHCARSRPGQPGQESDRAEERGGHQGRPTHHLLQQDARGDREPRWRGYLEPDQRE